MKLYEVYEKEKGELIRNIVTSIKLDEELDVVKEILDRIEGKLKEEIEGRDWGEYWKESVAHLRGLCRPDDTDEF